MAHNQPTASSSEVTKRSQISGAFDGPKTIGYEFELSDDQNIKINVAFDLFDPECTGFIEAENLEHALRALGFEPQEKEVKQMLGAIDKQATGRVSFKEFARLMAMKVQEKDNTKKLLKDFHLFDDNNTGTISFEDLKRVASDLGELVTDEELREMLDDADVDRDGKFGQDDFLSLMKQTNL